MRFPAGISFEMTVRLLKTEGKTRPCRSAALSVGEGKGSSRLAREGAAAVDSLVVIGLGRFFGASVADAARFEREEGDGRSGGEGVSAGANGCFVSDGLVSAR
jgi:hypothetical protein